MKAKPTTEIKAATTEIVETAITKEAVLKQLIRLFYALEYATQDTATALDVITRIADGVEADPEFSRKIMTPENIQKAYALKAKSEKGTIKLVDIETAFPELVAQIPFWNVVKTFM